MGSIANLFGYLLNWLYGFFNNYGVAIIVFSVILRLLLLPLSIKQQITLKKSAKLQGKLKEIQKKYKNNPEKMNQETIELYKKENMSPFSGCLSNILQIVIILSVFFLISRPLTYMKKVDQEVINNYSKQIEESEEKPSAYKEIAIIEKYGNEDEKVYLNMDFIGLNLSRVPSQNLGEWKVYIIPVLYIISSFISIKLTTYMQSGKKKKSKIKLLNEDNKKAEVIDTDSVDEMDEMQESMEQMSKSMTMFMPIMTIAIAFIAPLGLALYWLISNVLMVTERLVIEFVTNRIDTNKEEIENA